MSDMKKLLSGGDIRSLGESRKLLSLVHNQDHFDELFSMLLLNDRLISMRAGDVIEKITKENPAYLHKHKSALIKLTCSAINKELKWHLCLILARLKLTKSEAGKVWDLLNIWLKDKKESRIVRVNSLQSLFEMQLQYAELRKDFLLTVQQVQRENIPSLNARIRKLIQEKVL